LCDALLGDFLIRLSIEIKNRKAARPAGNMMIAARSADKLA
jgi:hypothetical protein